MHTALIKRTQSQRLVGHILRDATAIEAREKAAPKPPKPSVPAPRRLHRKSGTAKSPEQMTRIERPASGSMTLEQMLAEHLWASFHIWERTQRGIFPKGTFEATAGPFLCELLGTACGGAWWRRAKHTAFIPGLVVDVDAVLAKNSGASVAVNKDSHDS